jgi:hypothetical protein
MLERRKAAARTMERGCRLRHPLPAIVFCMDGGATILTLRDRNQTASEVNGHGLFTGILLDG